MARALALLKTLMAQVSWLGSIGIYFSFEYLGFCGCKAMKTLIAIVFFGRPGRPCVDGDGQIFEKQST